MSRIVLTVIYFIFSVILSIQYVSWETRKSLDVIDLKQSFTNVPDALAKYSFTIYTDLPVKNDIKRAVAWLQGYPGHSFIRLTKISGTKCVTKTIGLYPKIPVLSLLYHQKTPGKFSDDSRHAFNLYETMDLTKFQFNSLLNKIVSKTNSPQYHIQEYNCTDFALEMYNSIRPWHPLYISKDTLMNHLLVMSTPGKLFELLQQERAQPGKY